MHSRGLGDMDPALSVAANRAGLLGVECWAAWCATGVGWRLMLCWQQFAEIGSPRGRTSVMGSGVGTSHGRDAATVRTATRHAVKA